MVRKEHGPPELATQAAEEADPDLLRAWSVPSWMTSWGLPQWSWGKKIGRNKPFAKGELEAFRVEGRASALSVLTPCIVRQGWPALLLPPGPGGSTTTARRTSRSRTP
jgi:hypothetical protein